MKKSFALLLLITILLTSIVSCSDQTKQSNNTHKDINIKQTNMIDTPKEVEKKVYHNIYFDTNGGTGITSETVEKGSQLNTAPTTKRTNYLFEGWYLDQSLTQAAVFPVTIENDITLYAKWLKIKDKKTCNDISIDSGIITTENKYFYVTPNGFDLDRLTVLDYKITIKITYDVYYKKDYDVLFDIGYMGAPEYEVSLTNNNDIGQYQNKQKAPKSQTTKTISDTYNASDLKNTSIKLSFSSDNIQNIIYFKNIKVEYSCHK